MERFLAEIYYFLKRKNSMVSFRKMKTLSLVSKAKKSRYYESQFTRFFSKILSEFHYKVCWHLTNLTFCLQAYKS